MAKVTNLKVANPEKDQELTNKKIDDLAGKEPIQKDIEIKSASYKDMMCNYSYELLTGVTKGDELSRAGVAIIHDDLVEAFAELKIFVAHIDGAFAHWAKNDTPLKDLEADAELNRYNIFSFNISGVEENKAVVFSGSKSVTYGTIPIRTPKIKFSGSYLYMEELQERIRVVIKEVEAYMNGKHAPQYEQSSLPFGEEQNADYNFDEAKVN